MSETILRELLAKQEKYYMAMCKAKDEYTTDMRQILEAAMGGRQPELIMRTEVK